MCGISNRSDYIYNMRVDTYLISTTCRAESKSDKKMARAAERPQNTTIFKGCKGLTEAIASIMGHFELI